MEQVSKQVALLVINTVIKQVAVSMINPEVKQVIQQAQRRPLPRRPLPRLFSSEGDIQNY